MTKAHMHVHASSDLGVSLHERVPYEAVTSSGGCAYCRTWAHHGMQPAWPKSTPGARKSPGPLAAAAHRQDVYQVPDP